MNLLFREVRSQGWRWGVLAMLIGAQLNGCTFDPDDRCGPNQKLSGDNDRCVCADGFALTDAGCVACGAHEVAGVGGCACESGYARAGDGDACELVPTALGAACSTQTPCTDSTYSSCQLVGEDQGYCTNTGCTDSSGCSGGYACDTSATPSYCKRPPSGLGKSCASSADCADTEATFCDMFQTHQCLVQNCSLSADDCFIGWVCKDLASLGLPITLCVPEGSL